MYKRQIILRRLENSDVEDLYAIYSDTKAMKFRGSKPMTDLSDARRFVADQHLSEGGITTIRKVAELDGQVLGTVMLRFDRSKVDECEIGYSLGREHWGRGLGTAVLSRLMEDLGRSTEISKLTAYCHRDNLASIKILERSGFVRVSLDKDSGIFFYEKTCFQGSEGIRM